MNGDFKDDLLDLIHRELEPHNLIAKKLNERKITGLDFVNYFKSEVENYQLNSTLDHNKSTCEISTVMEDKEKSTEKSMNILNQKKIPNNNHSRSFILDRQKHSKRIKFVDSKIENKMIHSDNLERKLIFFLKKLSVTVVCRRQKVAKYSRFSTLFLIKNLSKLK